MTTRNLNQTWRDVVFKQYAADYDADVPFPVRYLIKADTWGRDIFIEIPHKIDLRTFKKAVLDAMKATHKLEDPTHHGEHISVRPRKPVASRPEESHSEGRAEEDGDLGNEDAGTSHPVDSVVGQ